MIDMLMRIVCWFIGHNWSKYSERSSYPWKMCLRCGKEEDKCPSH